MAAERIGYVGVGAMGLPMARRLLQAGYEVVFTSRRSDASRMLEEAGATSVPTPLVVADQSDVLMTCLPSDSELFQVYLGPDGVIEHLHPGATIIDFSSTSPMMMQRIADEAAGRQIRVIDAPVSGGVFGAENGTLTIMAGCPYEVFQEAHPILSVLGKQIFHVGDVGMGKVFKIVNNVLTGTTMVLVGEALSLAANAGADLSLLYDVVSTSSGNSAVWSDLVPKLLRGVTAPVGFKLDLMRKDMGLGAELGSDLGTPMPLTALALQFYTAACARGMGRQNAGDIALLVARLADAEFVQEEQQEEQSDAA